MDYYIIWEYFNNSKLFESSYSKVSSSKSIILKEIIGKSTFQNKLFEKLIPDKTVHKNVTKNDQIPFFILKFYVWRLHVRNLNYVVIKSRK